MAATDSFSTRAWACGSTASPRSFARTMAIRSGGRGRLPTWVVRIRSVLRFIPMSRCFVLRLDAQPDQPVEGRRIVEQLARRRTMDDDAALHHDGIARQ